MDGRLNLDEERAARSVVAKGIPAGVTESDLRIHFQRRKNGGGEVESVSMGKQSAVITFEDPEGMSPGFLIWPAILTELLSLIYYVSACFYGLAFDLIAQLEYLEKISSFNALIGLRYPVLNSRVL